VILRIIFLLCQVVCGNSNAELVFCF
jgi:hypothetical protein